MEFRVARSMRNRFYFQCDHYDVYEIIYYVDNIEVFLSLLLSTEMCSFQRQGQQISYSNLMKVLEFTPHHQIARHKFHLATRHLVPQQSHIFKQKSGSKILKKRNFKMMNLNGCFQHLDFHFIINS